MNMMERWLKFGPSKTRKSTKDNENMESKSSTSGVRTSLIRKLASSDSGERGTKTQVRQQLSDVWIYLRWR